MRASWRRGVGGSDPAPAHDNHEEYGGVRFPNRLIIYNMSNPMPPRQVYTYGPLAPWLRRVIRDKRRGKSTKWKCTLDAAWVSEWSKAATCPLTGLPLVANRHSDPCAPSLDRLDPTKGYTPANTRVVSLFANVARNVWSDAEFRLLILATAAHMRH